MNGMEPHQLNLFAPARHEQPATELAWYYNRIADAAAGDLSWASLASAVDQTVLFNDDMSHDTRTVLHEWSLELRTLARWDNEALR